jgi:hypothetical protein
MHYYKPYGKLTLIPLSSTTPFYTITIDFIIDMPPARDAYIGRTYNTILVLVNKLTKHVTYIATIKDLIVDSLVDII